MTASLAAVQPVLSGSRHPSPGLGGGLVSDAKPCCTHTGSDSQRLVEANGNGDVDRGVRCTATGQVHRSSVWTHDAIGTTAWASDPFGADEVVRGGSRASTDRLRDRCSRRSLANQLGGGEGRAEKRGLDAAGAMRLPGPRRSCCLLGIFSMFSGSTGFTST